MKNRYLYHNCLTLIRKDIYFLQEVDNHFYYLQSSELPIIILIYRYHKSWIKKKKDDIESYYDKKKCNGELIYN